MSALTAHAQANKKVTLVHTDALEFNGDQVNAQKLIGNVHLSYDGTQFYCDSAYWYDNEDFDAFSRIRIVEPSGYLVTGDAMKFVKATSVATMTGAVTLKDKDLTLTTKILSYDLNTDVAFYPNGGRIVSTKNQNTLTSTRGSYHSKTQVFYFKQDVLLKNPEYTVRCDTMDYNTQTEVTYFKGPTHIVGDETAMYCENGVYNTKTDQARFGRHARVTKKNTLLLGDSIYYDGVNGFGDVYGHVIIHDTTNKFTIQGDYGHHIEQSRTSYVTGNTLLTQVYEGDTLFVRSDTLFDVSDSLGNDILRSFHHVRFYRSDIQGRCDSLQFIERDSLMLMFDDPIIWNASNQITADTIQLQFRNGMMKDFRAAQHAFAISDAEAETDSIDGPRRYFNQLKGREMIGQFSEGDLRRVRLIGNGELLYYPVDEKDKAAVVAWNRGTCSDIELRFFENKPRGVLMERSADSLFKPIKMVDPSEEKLDAFTWREAERPWSKTDLDD
ncbi:MAG: OstA-like protein [Flavobacteriales bacterium]